LLSRRHDATLAAALLGAVLLLDLLWSLLEGSTGKLAYGLIDEPAHLATCVVLLLAAVKLTDSRPAARLVVSALVGSVAIDLDHVPGYLGSHLLSGAMPRPYSHGLLLVAVLAGVGVASKRAPVRQVALGLAFGVSAHLFRDLATGPGVPLIWPASSGMVAVPYGFFAIALALAAACAAWPRRVPAGLGFGHAAAVGALIATAFAIAPPSASAHTVSIGAYIPGADENPALIDDFESQTGRQATFVVSYKEWSQEPFVTEQLDGIWDHGAVPVITWEPWDISLKGIAAGSYDGYVREAAEAAARWDKPLMIRFGQEMNGDWFPWGGKPGPYKAAWRHLVRVFRGAGADNVRWVWNPYVNSRGGRLSFARYFPGEKWVDWVGLDALNWGGPLPWSSFGQIIERSYHEMLALSSKPMVIAETGSGEEGGSKARWLSSMLDQNVPHMGHVRALAFWSQDDPRGDLRVDSSSAALKALRSGLDKPLYRSSRRRLLKTPARLGR
jgi:mannan endo-1,4-beta-mannosidase